MFSKKDTLDQEDIPNQDKTTFQSDNSQKKKEEEEFDKCWDEYDDGDDEDISEEKEEKNIEKEKSYSQNYYKEY